MEYCKKMMTHQSDTKKTGSSSQYILIAIIHILNYFYGILKAFILGVHAVKYEFQALITSLCLINRMEDFKMYHSKVTENDLFIVLA